ncbi:MAG: enoyl-CoA hydratase/isomerase family protein, partial [Deltaproteobacteria bacterium]|nr:enoyl-CoA hydratase/isomerase family protein [Deltaproteobacteria bacterium]
METLLFQCKDQIATIVLNRPKVLNALSPKLYKELSGLLEKIAADRSIRALIITGAGEKAFAAGADISAMQPLPAHEARALAMIGQKPLNQIVDLPQPVIAAVNGLALGGGCELALACDLRIASERAKFGQPEINLGIIPGGGGTQRLPRIIGMARAKDLIFSGRMISAQEACEFGLVNRVVAHEELMSSAESVAKELCTKGPIAMALAKTSVNKAMETP